MLVKNSGTFALTSSHAKILFFLFGALCPLPAVRHKTAIIIHTSCSSSSLLVIVRTSFSEWYGGSSFCWLLENFLWKKLPFFMCLAGIKRYFCAILAGAGCSQLSRHFYHSKGTLSCTFSCTSYLISEGKGIP